jgi:hypothetical protein
VNSLAEDMGMDIVVAIDGAQELKKIKWIAFVRA